MLIQLEIHLGGGVHCRWERKPRRATDTVFFTPLDPWRDEIEEEFLGDLSKPRQVHLKTQWKHAQDAVYCIHLAKAREKGFTSWQTRSHTVIAFSFSEVVSPSGEAISYQRHYTKAS